MLVVSSVVVGKRGWCRELLNTSDAVSIVLTSSMYSMSTPHRSVLEASVPASSANCSA